MLVKVVLQRRFERYLSFLFIKFSTLDINEKISEIYFNLKLDIKYIVYYTINSKQ